MIKNKRTEKIFSLDISITSLEEVVSTLLHEKSITVAITNVNTVVSCDKDPKLQKMINDFSYKVTDGMPLVWYLRSKNIKQERIRGSDVFHGTITKGLDSGLKHFLLGSTREVLFDLRENLLIKYPDMKIIGIHSPPFGTDEEVLLDIKANIEKIKNTDVLWVGLGMPKQEKIIHYLKEYEFNKVGIGASFEWEAGTKNEAPEVIQNMGFEWLYRLIQEPRRLWRRYFFDFLYLFRFLFRNN